MAMKKAVKKTVKKRVKWWDKRVPLKYFWPIFLILFLLFFLTIFNLISLWQVRQAVTSDLQELVSALELEKDIKLQIKQKDNKLIFEDEVKTFDQEIDFNVPTLNFPTATDNIFSSLEIEPASSPSDFIPPISEQLLSGHLSSISDSFSGLTNIDESLTDMYWDDSVTAFTFPPLFSLNKQSDCSEIDCGFSRDMLDMKSSCLQSGCLQKKNSRELTFAGQDLRLPPVLQDKEILSINFFALSDRWLLGIVTGPSSAEKGWVYSFDGLSFVPLLTDTTEYQINPRYQRGGGKIFFGGDDQDFLVLYAGYDAIAYRFREDRVEDISKYFGLRVSNGGFEAQIFKLGEGALSTYYVCSLSENKAKIIKIWSQDTLNSLGALDFSTAFAARGFYPSSIVCGISDVNEKKIAIAAKINGAYELWNFQDNGFDNSRSRQVTSINLKANNREEVKAAVIADFGADSYSGCPGYSVNAYLANEKNNFQEVTPYLWHGFSKLGQELYWRFVFNPEDNQFYSPWFDHINRLSYLSPEE